MLSERHELNKIALSELKKDVEKTRQFSSYFSKMADLLLFLNEIYDTKEKSLEQLKQWNKIWYEEVSPEKYVDSLGNPAFCDRNSEKIMDRSLHFYIQRCGVDLFMRLREDCLI